MGHTHNGDQIDQEQASPNLQHVDAERLALLVATDQIPLPIALDNEESRRVIDLIREHRRQSLLRYVARCIAIDIHNSEDRKGM